MSNSFRLRTNEVEYRKGYVEVMESIHPGLVNLECWEISVESDISEIEWVGGVESDRDIIANIELELTPTGARALAKALIDAAGEAEQGAAG